MIYTKTNNTYIASPKTDIADRIDIEIGDSKQVDFFPQAKFMRWDNECNLSVRLKDDDKSTAKVSKSGDNIYWAKNGMTARFYEDTTINEGGYEFDVVLDKKPVSNILEFTIETKGLDFYYQGELTEIDKAEGAIRPENVIGSYAVYHSEKAGDYSQIGGKDYKCGKAFHIYRPKVYDAKGSWVWGVLNIDVANSLLTITVPQDFLNKAVYPVTIDPTFGYTTEGGSGLYNASSRVRKSGTTYDGSVGTATSMTISTSFVSGEGTTGRCAIYLNSNSTKIASTDEWTATTTWPTKSWKTVNFESNPTLSAVTYEMVWYSPIGATYSSTISYDSGGGNYAVNNATSVYPNWVSPVTWLDQSAYIISIYATYTASGGTAVKDIIGCGLIPFAR